jgi:hypothetical protein
VLLGSPDERRAFSAWASPTKIAIAANKIGKEIFMDQPLLPEKKPDGRYAVGFSLRLPGRFPVPSRSISKGASVWLMKD